MREEATTTTTEGTGTEIQVKETMNPSRQGPYGSGGGGDRKRGRSAPKSLGARGERKKPKDMPKRTFELLWLCFVKVAMFLTQAYFVFITLFVDLLPLLHHVFAFVVCDHIMQAPFLVSKSTRVTC